MQKYPKIISEIKDDEAETKILRRRWRLYLPDYTEHDFYRQAVSFDAFFNGRNRRNWKNKDKKGWILYHMELEVEHEMSWNLWQKTYKENGLPELKRSEAINVYSIWDFYKLIGYDYKTKKWLNVPEKS